MTEKTELKDIKWANKEIKKVRDLLNNKRYEEEVDDFTTGVLSGLKKALNILDQLDQPETLSKEWIDANSKLGAFTYSNGVDIGYFVKNGALEDKLVPEQELPVIPQFVADWVEGNKQFEEKWNDYSKEDAINDTIHFTIYGLFADYPATNSDVELRKPVLKWLSLNRGNYFKLVNAVRYDYEVEKEQKYYALIKGHENIGSDDKYWNYCITDESLDIGDNKIHADVLAEYVLNATKYEWENLGINEDNACFVEVEEEEE